MKLLFMGAIALLALSACLFSDEDETSSNVLTRTDTYDIIEKTDSTFVITEDDSYCDGAQLVDETLNVTYRYSIENGVLKLSGYGCIYEAYSGSSSDISGSWTFTDMVEGPEFDKYEYCEEDLADDKANLERNNATWTLKITESTYTSTSRVTINCAADMFIWDNWQKVDCNTLKATNQNVTATRTISLTSESISMSTTVSNGSKSCSISMERSANTVPDCEAESEFNNCIEENDFEKFDF